MSDDETVLACPDCDSARLLSIQRQKPSGAPAVEADGTHRCKDCKSIVTPVERPPHCAGQPTHGLAKKLLDADQEAL